MNLKQMSNSDLHNKLKMFLDLENKLNQDILAHLVEVDRRRLYLEMAFPSLFEYLTVGIGFTAASAQRRIDAARLMRQIPEVAEQINSGAVSMVQISKVQAASRLLKKRGSIVTVENKKKLLNEIQNRTVRETELIIAQKFDLPVLTVEKSVVQKDESIRMEITFTKEEMEKVEAAKALLSHSLSDGSLKDLVLYLADRVIVQKTKLRVQKVKAAPQDKGVKNEAMAPLVNTKPAPVRESGVIDQTCTLPANLKKFIFNRDQCCQYQDSLTGKMCGSRYYLEVDHIQPKWSSGSNKIENLRVLCSSHNKYKYQVGR